MSKSPAGGARVGAGRPKKSEKYAGAVAKAEKRLADKLPQVADALLELALGVVVEELDKDSGERLVFAKAPDRAACEAVLNRIMGKPTERLEAQNDVSGALKIVVEYVDEAAPGAEDTPPISPPSESA